MHLNLLYFLSLSVWFHCCIFFTHWFWVVSLFTNVHEYHFQKYFLIMNNCTWFFCRFFWYHLSNMHINKHQGKRIRWDSNDYYHFTILIWAVLNLPVIILMLLKIVYSLVYGDLENTLSSSCCLVLSQVPVLSQAAVIIPSYMENYQIKYEGAFSLSLSSFWPNDWNTFFLVWTGPKVGKQWL